jgi:threonyl-tRNA synthetase
LICTYVFGSLGFENFTAQISLRDKENRRNTSVATKTGKKAECYYQCSKETKIWTLLLNMGSCFLWSKVGLGQRCLGKTMAIRNYSSGLQPTERFDLTYKGSDNELHRPVMIHRAPFGSMERFIAILLEHTAGNFLWLMPEQAIILSLSEKYEIYAKKVLDLLENHEIRAQIDNQKRNNR